MDRCKICRGELTEQDKKYYGKVCESCERIIWKLADKDYASCGMIRMVCWCNKLLKYMRRWIMRNRWIFRAIGIVLALLLSWWIVINVITLIVKAIMLIMRVVLIVGVGA